ncbi:MAG: NUDIX domain-containing protein [Minisyncoccia bacterium]
MEIKDKELHRVATTAIIHKDGKYLITKRSAHKKHFPNRWTVPGGGLSSDDYTNLPNKTGENQWYNALINGLRREVKEEVGLEISEPEYLLDLAFVKDDGTPNLVLSYFSEYISGDVVLDEDATEFKWVGVEELKYFDLIKGIDEEIMMVDEILKKRKLS